MFFIMATVMATFKLIFSQARFVKYTVSVQDFT